MSMRRGMVAAGVGLILAATAGEAVIKAVLPLETLLNNSTFVVVAKVDRLFADKPAMILTVQEDLKGKAPFRRLPVTLNGDEEAAKEKQVPLLRKRLAEGLPLVLFVSKTGKRLITLAYTDGTWFQVLGTETAPGRFVFALTHGEPYLRRSFRGSTAELRDLLSKALQGKGKLPPYDEKAKPGYGPEAKTPAGASRVRSGGGRTLPAVIPTFAVGGPLAILAILFPSVFGGVLVLFRQWLAFLTVLSVNGTLLLVQALWGTELRSAWWMAPSGLWFLMTLVTWVGLIWSWKRQVRNLGQGPHALETPQRAETIVLASLAVALGGMSLWVYFAADLTWPADAASNLVLTLAAGTLAALAIRWLRGVLFPASLHPPVATEGLILGVGGLVALVLLVGQAREVKASVAAGSATTGRRAEFVQERWKFVTPEKGLFVATPLVRDGRVYAASAHLATQHGAVWCLDAATGKQLWGFDGDLERLFKHAYSSPTVADGLLYIGEGFHDDKFCRVWCLDAATGRKVWHQGTDSQTESSPAVWAGKVYCGAGNDGFLCLDATDRTFEKPEDRILWRYPPRENRPKRLLRFGAPPLVHGGLVLIGTGVDRNLRKQDLDPGETALLCLDARSGGLKWKIPVDLPCWAQPVVRVETDPDFPDQARTIAYFAVGNGDILKDADQYFAQDRNAGAILAVDVAAGKVLWRHDLPNGVLDRPALSERHLYCGCRDGCVYCLDLKEQTDKREVWRLHLGSPVVAGPALVVGPDGPESLFAAGSAGRLVCLDPADGTEHWSYRFEGLAHLTATPQVTVHRTSAGVRRHITLAGGVGHPSASDAVVVCLEDRLVEGER